MLSKLFNFFFTSHTKYRNLDNRKELCKEKVNSALLNIPNETYDDKIIKSNDRLKNGVRWAPESFKLKKVDKYSI